MLNANLLELEDYSNWRFLGVGKLSKGQKKRRKTRQERRAENKGFFKFLAKHPLANKNRAKIKDLETQLANSNAEDDAEIARLNAEMQALKLSMDAQAKAENVVVPKVEEVDVLVEEKDMEVVEEKKILGMKKKVAVPVLIVGGLGVATGIFFIVRHIRK